MVVTAAGRSKGEDHRGNWAGIGPKANWPGCARPKRKLGWQCKKSRKMKIKQVGCDGYWVENSFWVAEKNSKGFAISV
jgi:hypothetical protein